MYIHLHKPYTIIMLSRKVLSFLAMLKQKLYSNIYPTCSLIACFLAHPSQATIVFILFETGKWTYKELKTKRVSVNDEHPFIKYFTFSIMAFFCWFIGIDLLLEWFYNPPKEGSGSRNCSLFVLCTC